MPPCPALAADAKHRLSNGAQPEIHTCNRGTEVSFEKSPCLVAKIAAGELLLLY